MSLPVYTAIFFFFFTRGQEAALKIATKWSKNVRGQEAALRGTLFGMQR